MNDRIKKLRKELDLTQQKFGAAISVKGNTVAQWESGRNDPPDSSITFICREFNVNEDWLRNGVGEMFIDPATFSLDEYAQSNKLNKTEISIIRGFMELDPNTRQAIYNIFSNAFNENDVAIPDDPQELERLYPPIDTKNSDVG